MLTKIIQSLFFLAICTTINGSQNNKQRDIVHTKLCEKHAIVETPKATRPIIQPLPHNLKFHRPTIRANQIKELCETGKTEQAILSYQKTCMPDDLSMLKPETQKAFTALNNSIKNAAYKGNSNAQIAVTEKSIQRLSPFFKNPEFFTQMKDKHCAYAFELLDFTINLNNRAIPITITDNINKELIDLRYNTDPATAYITETIRYLQAHNETQKKQRCSILKDLHCTDDPEIEATCQFLINYGDNTLSTEDATKKFIQEITSQKSISRLLSDLANTPLCSHVITKLETTSLEKNDPHASDLHYLLAELHYKSKNYIKAHNFYTKNKVSYLKEKKVANNAFKACILALQSFCKDDIIYLTALVGNIANQLKQLDSTDPLISYHAALLIQALIVHTPTMTIEDKTALLLNGLQHLTYTQKNTELTTEFHILLSDIYEEKNDMVAALKHLKQALECRSHYGTNTQDVAITNILTQAEKTDPELYRKLAPFTKMVIDFINNQCDQVSKQKSYTLLPQFCSSDLCTQLLPYCEQAYTTKNNYNPHILCIMALAHKNGGNNALACDYIDQLTQPLPSGALPLKASIYAAANKGLPLTALETIFKLFINNKKPSLEKQTTILSFIIPCFEFFAQQENRTVALRLITKFTELQNTPAEIIQLAYIISRDLTAENNTYVDQWHKELDTCQFYTKMQDSSCYDGNTNFAAGVLLMQKKPALNYEKILSYFTTALTSTTLPPHIVERAQDCCATLYCDWAMSMRHDTDAFLRLIDQAMQYDKSGVIAYEKAFFILHNSDDTNLINHALKLLEKNIKKNDLELLEENIDKNNLKPLQENIKKDDITTELSQLQLAHAYLNYSLNPARLPIIQQCIPLDIDKAIAYLKPHNNNKILLDCLVNILSGSSSYIDENIKKQYINLEEALIYTTILIETNPNNINYITHRISLHDQMNNPAQAIEDIDRMLTTYNLSDTDITRAQLLRSKLAFLIHHLTLDNVHDQALECIKQLQHEENSIITIPLLPSIQKLIHHFITSNDMSDKAVEWCCVVAETHIADNRTQPPTTIPTEAQKELADYLFAAAQSGNLNAQLTLPLYASIMNYSDINAHYTNKCLHYSHAALLNPDNAAHKAKTSRIIDYVHAFADEGIALAYYILCTHYQKDTQQLEKTMLRFSKAKEQYHNLNDTTGIVEKIAISCKDAFLPYITRYMDNSTNKTLIDALATFTLGSMYQYSDELRTAGTLYLGMTLKPLSSTFKLPHYKKPMQTFLANSYYKAAVEVEQNRESIPVELLLKSVQFGLLPAAHKLAQLYIQQHQDGKNNLSINSDDFMPVLTQDATNSNHPHPDSVKLYQECLAIKNNNKSLQTALSPVKRIDLIAHYACEKNMIKHVQYKETSSDYNTALQLRVAGKPKEATASMQKAIDKENHPCAYMMLALNYLTGEITNRDYSRSEQLLDQALYYGLAIKARKNRLHQFHSASFLSTLLYYIHSLIKTNHPMETKLSLLSKINNSLETNGININDFCELFKKAHDINLASVFVPMKTEAFKTELTTILDTLNTVTNAEVSLDSRETLNSLLEYTNSLEKKIDVFSAEQKVELITKYALEKNMIKHINHKDSSRDYMVGIQCHAQGRSAEALIFWQKAAQKDNYPCAYIMLALTNLTGELTPQNYSSSKTLLDQALLYGLVAKNCNSTTKQFHNLSFLNKLIIYIDSLLTEPHPEEIKSYLLSTIKKTLTNDGINMTDFCELFKDVTTINLLLEKLWTRTQQESEQSLEVVFKNSLGDSFKMINKKNTIINEEKNESIIKYPDHKESPGYLSFDHALTQGNLSKAFDIAKDLVNKEENPMACLYLSCDYIRGDKKNNKLAENFLKKALSWGLAPKQFCHYSFLNSLCSYMTMVIQTCPKSLKQTLLSTIKTALETNTIDLAIFHKIFQDASEIDLSMTPEWSGNKKNIPEPAEIIYYSEKPIDLCALISGKWSNILLIKDQDYKETSANFLNALQAYSQKDTTKALQYMQLAATKEHHPTACIILALNHLKGDGIQKSYSMSEKFLGFSCCYGITTQQFCNNDVFKGLCDYIKELLTQPHPRIAKQNLLSTLKKVLAARGINDQAFCDAFQKVTSIDLASQPEWTTESNSQEIQTLTKLKNSLIKDVNHKETCSSYILGSNTLNQGKTEDGITIMEKVAHNNHPNASLFLAHLYLDGEKRDKNYDTSEKFLHKALTHGIITKQFYNTHFIDMLFMYMDMVSCEIDQPIFKQHVLSTIKSALENNGVNITLFNMIFKETTGIDLPSIPEWSTENKESLTFVKEKPTNLCDLFKQLSIPAGLVKNSDYTELSANFLNAMQAYSQEDKVQYIKLMRLAATKEYHPIAGILLALNYLKGDDIQKNYSLSEKFLAVSFGTGITAQQFCNNNVLKGVCEYIKELLTTPQPRITKQYLLSTIKRMLEMNGVNLEAFCDAFQKITTIDLASRSEWTTEKNSQEMQTLTKLKNSLIKNINHKETCQAYIDAINENETEKVLIFMEAAALQNHPSACIYLAYVYLAGEKKAKNYDISEEFINKALTHGIITKQFYNEDFLNMFFVYIEMVLWEPDQLIFKQRVLSTIKSTLETNGVNITLFNMIFQETSGIHLPSLPEWSIKQQEKIEQQKKTKQPEKTEQPESIAFLNVTAALETGNIMEAMELARTVTEKEHHPLASMILASEYLRGGVLKKSNQLSEKYLKQSLEWGLLPKQFRSDAFLQALCAYIAVLIENHPKSTQQTLLPMIKNALKANSIDLITFHQNFQAHTGTDLSVIPAWNK